MKRKFKTYAAYYNPAYGQWKVIVAEDAEDGAPYSFTDYGDEFESEESAKGIAMLKNWEQRQADYEDPGGNND